MPAKGRTLSPPRHVSAQTFARKPGASAPLENVMNKPVPPSDLVTPKVTTGPIMGSRKVYATPEAAPDLRVPLREIVLSKEANEPNLPVYDTTGVYTDNDAAIDVEKGLKRTR